MAQALPTPHIVPVAHVEVTTVKPLQKTPHVETINAAFLDLGPLDVYVPLFFAYRLQDKTEVAYLQLVNQLKESLQKVLVAFFGFAGRWVAIFKGSEQRQLLCNDEGVPFIEGYVDKDLDSVVHASAAFQPVTELQGYELLGLDSTRVKQEILPDGLPSLFVQVTRFKCGGVVVATTFNHATSDGKGFFNFLTAWSDLSRTNETMAKVDHNRSLTEKPAFKEYFSKCTVPGSDSGSPVFGSNDEPVKLPQWAMTAFEVSASIITSLKQEAKDKEYGPGFVSTGDCVLAHVWKSLSRLPSSMLGAKKLAVTTNVEGRSKFYDPPIPDMCGNVMTPTVVSKIPADEVRELPVASIALKIREKLQTTEREEWLSLQRLEETSEVMSGMSSMSSGDFATMVASYWFAFPMYEIDFGFGKPYFSSGLNFLFTLDALGSIYVGRPIPSSPSSIAIVYIWSSPKVLEVLRNDPEFLLLFLPEEKCN